MPENEQLASAAQKTAGMIVDLQVAATVGEKL